MKKPMEPLTLDTHTINALANSTRAAAYRQWLIIGQQRDVWLTYATNDDRSELHQVNQFGHYRIWSNLFNQPL